MNTQPATAIAEYSPIEAALAGIEKFRNLVVDVKTEQGMKDAKAAHREVAAVRIALEKTREQLKKDVLERGRLIDGEAKRIAVKVAEIEDPIKTQIQAEERRAEEARHAAIEAEQKRLAEEEAARKRAEEERLAAERRKLDEDRARFEAEQRAAREKVEAEERASRKRIEEAEAQAKAQRQAEEDRLRAERERVDAERRKLEEDARAEQFRKDEEARAVRLVEQIKRETEENARAAAERERQRLILEKTDARTSLELWRNRYGHMPEYADVVRAIDECLEPA